MVIYMVRTSYNLGGVNSEEERLTGTEVDTKLSF